MRRAQHGGVGARRRRGWLVGERCAAHLVMRRNDASGNISWFNFTRYFCFVLFCFLLFRRAWNLPLLAVAALTAPRPVRAPVPVFSTATGPSFVLLRCLSSTESLALAPSRERAQDRVSVFRGRAIALPHPPAGSGSGVRHSDSGEGGARTATCRRNPRRP